MKVNIIKSHTPYSLKLSAKNKSATKSTPDSVIEEMAKQINALLSEKGLSVKDIEGIGIGCPGAVTSGTGMVDFLPNLGWKNVPLVKKLKEYFDTEIIISNDANVAALENAPYCVGFAAETDNLIDNARAKLFRKNVPFPGI